MPKIKFIQANGHIDEVDAAVGSSIMQAATRFGVAGIIGECGGAAMCATCHIVIDPDWIASTGTMGEVEDEMLNNTLTERQPTSRLSCQINITDAMDGMTVHVPSE